MARVTTVEALQEMNNDVLAWVVSTLEISQSLVDFCQDCKVQEVILTNRIYICASLRLSNSLRDEFLRRIEKFILLKFFYRTRKMDVVEISVALEIFVTCCTTIFFKRVCHKFHISSVEVFGLPVPSFMLTQLLRKRITQRETELLSTAYFTQSIVNFG